VRHANARMAHLIGMIVAKLSCDFINLANPCRADRVTFGEQAPAWIDGNLATDSRSALQGPMPSFTSWDQTQVFTVNDLSD
jgi:hypothetical protein